MGYLDIIRQVEAARRGQSSEQASCETNTPAFQITWIDGKGRIRGPAQVDMFHADDEGTVWAFVTLLDGWIAVNTKHVTAMRRLKEE